MERSLSLSPSNSRSEGGRGGVGRSYLIICLPLESRNKISLKQCTTAFIWIGLETFHAPFRPSVSSSSFARSQQRLSSSKSMRPLFPGINRTIFSFSFPTLARQREQYRSTMYARFHGSGNRDIKAHWVYILSRSFPPSSLSLLSPFFLFVKGTFFFFFFPPPFRDFAGRFPVTFRFSMSAS